MCEVLSHPLSREIQSLEFLRSSAERFMPINSLTRSPWQKQQLSRA
jgi:hypothetical protein